MKDEVITCEVCGVIIEDYHQVVRDSEDSIICKCCAYDAIAPEFDKLLNFLRCAMHPDGVALDGAREIIASLNDATLAIIYANDAEANAQSIPTSAKGA